MVPVKNVERPSLLKILFGSLLTLFSSKTVFAQGMPIPDTSITSKTEFKLDDSARAEAPKPDKRPITVEGFVVDSTTGEPLIFVTIIVEGTTIGCNTDIDGHFRLTVPVEQGTNSVTLSVSYLGYEEKTLSLPSKNIQVSIELVPDRSMILGGPSIITGVISAEPEPVDEYWEKFRIQQWLKSQGGW
jgi:hypothetical protein